MTNGKNSFLQVVKLPNVRGRVRYISDSKRQENLYATFTNVELKYWIYLSKENQKDFRKSGTEGKCIEARELIIMLPPSLIQYDPDMLLKYFSAKFVERYDVAVAFYVRGVFEDDNARVFRQAEFDKTLSNMQLTFPGGGTREDAERYLTAANFMGGTILDLPLMGRGFRILFRFPAIVLAFGIIVRLLRRARKLWHYQAWLFSYLPFVLAVLAVLMLCIDLPEIPSSFIPSKWSDFEFWKDLFLSHWKNVTRWTSAAPTFRDKELWGSASAMLLLSIFATILVAVSAAMTSIRSYKNMVLTCAAYILTLCLISLGTASSGKLSFCKEMYLVPCLWIGIDYMLYWQGRRFDLASHERRLSDDKNTSKATEETVEQT